MPGFNGRAWGVVGGGGAVGFPYVERPLWGDEGEGGVGGGVALKGETRKVGFWGGPPAVRRGGYPPSVSRD
ncbi:hypothetical protein CCP3SC1_1320005 [Gammaproteobacteria bacterium]